VSRGNPGKVVLVNLAILAALVLLVWGCGEVYYRFFFEGTDSFGLTRPCRRWILKNYSSTITNVGERDRMDYAKAIPPGKRRVTFLGDSFTLGHGIADVDRRFTNLVRRDHPGWDVQTLAHAGWDTKLEIEGLDRFAAQGFALDTVVLVYVLNDIEELVPEWPAVRARLYAGLDHEPFLVRHSDFVNVLYWRWRVSRDPDVRGYYGFVRDAYRGEPFRIERERLREARDYCASRGVRLLVVTFPFLHALGPDYAYADAHRALAATWKDLGVPELDLLDVYAGSRPVDVVIGKYDAHPNERAHAMAAQAIGRFVEDELKRSR
jgi:hypothetical protein